MTRNTHTYCRAFSSGTVTTCFYNLGISWLGFEHATFCLRDKLSNPLRNRPGCEMLECKHWDKKGSQKIKSKFELKTKFLFETDEYAVGTQFNIFWSVYSATCIIGNDNTIVFDDDWALNHHRCSSIYQDCFILHRFFDHFHDYIFSHYLYADNLVGHMGMWILLPAAWTRSVL